MLVQGRRPDDREPAQAQLSPPRALSPLDVSNLRVERHGPIDDPGIGAIPLKLAAGLKAAAWSRLLHLEA